MWPFNNSPSSAPSSSAQKTFDHYVKLLDVDIQMIQMGIEPISTVTWVEDSIDEELVRKRVAEIVSFNPWLATGRFVQHNPDVENEEENKEDKDEAEEKKEEEGGNKPTDTSSSASTGGSNSIQMGYNDKPTSEEMDRLIQVVEEIEEEEEEGNSSTTSYTQLMKMVEKYLLKAGGIDVKNPTQPQQQFWKVVIVKPKNMLVVSMTHALGDGASYYQLYQMLISGKIEKVQIERVFVNEEQKVKLFGGQEEANLIKNWGYMVCFVRGLIQNSLINKTPSWFPAALQGERTTARFVLIDNQKIDSIKTKHKEEKAADVPFISTNDILTSWFFKETNLDNATMVINQRGRMDQLQQTTPTIGNYQHVLYYRSPDVQTPQLVRQSIQQMKRVVTSDQPIRAGDFVKSNGISIITNWSTFVNLKAAEGFRVQRHVPVQGLHSVPSTTAVCIVFEAFPGQLGAITMGKPSKLKSVLNTTPDQKPIPFELEQQEQPFMVL